MIKKRFLDYRNISFQVILLSISVFFIFFSLETSFVFRSISIPIIIVSIYTIINKTKIILTKQIMWFIALEFIYLFSLLVNSIRYNVGTSVILQMVYQLGIFIWYAAIFQKRSFNKKELNFYINSYITVCMICSIYLIINNLLLGRYTSTVLTVFGHEISKNFLGAFLSLGPLYSGLKVLYYKKNKIFNAILTIVMIIGLLFTNSRGAILSFIAGFGLSLYYYGNRKITKKQLLFIILLIIIVILSIRPILGLIPDWMYRRYFINSYNDMSNMDRLFRWKNALDSIKNSPIIGYGPGVFLFLPQYRVTELGVAISGDATYSHNTYIDVMVNGGILGIICFLGVLATTLKEMFIKNKIFRPAVISLLITSGILGAGKSVYFWNNIIFFGMISSYMRDNKDKNIFEI